MAYDPVVDFTKAEQSEGGAHYPEGDYFAKILGGKPMKSSDKETPGIRVTFQILRGKNKGKKISENFWLSPKALPRLMNLMKACGAKVPKKAAASSIIKAIKAKTVGISLEDDEYNNNIRSRVGFDFLTEEDFETDDDDAETDDDDDLEDEDDEEVEDEEEEDEDPLADLSRSELKKLIKSEKLDVRVLKSMSDDDLREAVAEAQGGDDEDEDEDLEDLDLEEL